MATQSYQSLQQQIAKLQEQAEAVRNEEVAGVISKIKEAIGVYGLTPADLFGRGVQAASRARGSTSSSAVAYADGQGGEWGGRGPRPLWLREAIAAGHSLEEFRVEAPAASRKPASGAPKRAARTSYKNPEGNETWSGFGRKPGWLVEALNAGHSLGTMAA